MNLARADCDHSRGQIVIRAEADLPLDEVAAALTAAGWGAGDGRPIERWDLYWIPALEVVLNVTSEPYNEERSGSLIGDRDRPNSQRTTVIPYRDEYHPV